MTVAFHDPLLRRAAEEADFCPAEWSVKALKMYRRRLQQLDAVHAEVDLHQTRSLAVRSRDIADGDGFFIQLDERVELLFHVERKSDGLAVRVVLDGFAVLRKEKSA